MNVMAVLDHICLLELTDGFNTNNEENDEIDGKIVCASG
jgi:hypothetical protein